MAHYGYMLLVLHSTTSQMVTQALASMELTCAQGHIMGFIAHCQQPPCAKDIEENLQISHPTVSGLLSRLEKKGFLELRPDPDDRRCKRIYVLPKGAACNETMHNTILGFEQKIVDGFSEADKQQFTLLLTRAMRNLSVNPNFQFEKEESNE